MSSPQDAIEVWQAPFFEQRNRQSSVSFNEQMEEARQKGFDRGLEEGRAKAREEQKKIADTLGKMVEGLARPYAAIDTVVVDEWVALAMRLAQHIVRRELMIDSSVIAQIAEEAVEALYRLEGEVVIYVHPDDAQQLRTSVPEALDGKCWRISEDAALSPGGCQIKTATSFVDASVERQMDLVFSALTQSASLE